MNFVRTSINTIKLKTVKCRYFEFSFSAYMYLCTTHIQTLALPRKRLWSLTARMEKRQNCEWARNLTVTLLLLLLLTFQRHEVETNLNSACRRTTNGAIVVLRIGLEQSKITIEMCQNLVLSIFVVRKSIKSRKNINSMHAMWTGVSMSSDATAIGQPCNCSMAYYWRVCIAFCCGKMALSFNNVCEKTQAFHFSADDVKYEIFLVTEQPLNISVLRLFFSFSFAT